MSDPALGLLMLALIVVVIMMGFATAFIVAAADRRVEIEADALVLQLLGGAKAQVGLALGHQALGVLAVHRHALRLPVGAERPADVGAFVPVEAQPLQVLEDLRFGAGLVALQVGVFDAQDERSALLPREQPVEERGARVAHLQVPGGRWRKADANLR